MLGMPQALADKTALITGASKGLGKAMAIALADAGAAVALVSRDAAKLNSVVDEIRANGGRAKAFVADVGDESQVVALPQAVTAKLGPRVDILINNAGINLRKPLTDFTLAEWRSVMDTN